GEPVPRIAGLPGPLGPDDGLGEGDEGDGVGHGHSWDSGVSRSRASLSWQGPWGRALVSSWNWTERSPVGAMPTGLLHVALLLPVDAGASSRPRWSYAVTGCPEGRFSGR